jgi:4-hydroxy-tetrahydrodipicolinate synthase
MTLSGIYPVVPTPFDETGQIDVESIKKLAPLMVTCGVQGITVLGVMGEESKLTDEERTIVIKTFQTELPKDFTLVVGVRAAGTDAAIHLALKAQELGANALLVGPPFVQNDDVLYTYYQKISHEMDIPLIIHDYPAETGILMSPEIIAKIHNESKGVAYVKLEDPPTGAKMDKLAQLTGGKLLVLGALGGMFAFEELDRGAVGIMTGFAYPELLVRLYDLHKSGKKDEAAKLFYDILPLITFEFQPKIGVFLRKHIYVQRGVFQTTKVRHPGIEADDKTLNQLHRIQEHLRQKGYDI